MEAEREFLFFEDHKPMNHVKHIAARRYLIYFMGEKKKPFKILRFYFFFFFFLRAALSAYGDSQARGPIRATAAGLRHSHSNPGSKPRL